MTASQNIYLVQGRVDKVQADRFRHFAANKLPRVHFEGEKVLKFRIDSAGGNAGYAGEIGQILYDLFHREKYKIIMQGIHLGSAALTLFLAGHCRQITAKTSGFIHLPVPNDGGPLNHEVRRETAEFIAKRTKLSVDEVFSLNEMPFGSVFMMQNGMADELVGAFE